MRLTAEREREIRDFKAYSWGIREDLLAEIDALRAIVDRNLACDVEMLKELDALRNNKT